MIAYRATWIVKPRCMGKALKYHEDRMEKIIELSGFVEGRVYTPKIGPNVLIQESVWESVEDHDKFYAELSAEIAAIWDWDGWFELVEKVAGNEVWNVKKWGTA